MTIPAFCDWLSNTSLSMVFQNVFWIIPSVQTVHILAIATVMASIVMVDFRLLGVTGRGQTVPEMTHRFLPWVWCSVVVLFFTGLILIIAEPNRTMTNPVFYTKMSLLVCALLLTWAVQRSAMRRERFWETRRALSFITAIGSLALWVGILTAGRWIAYAAHS